MRKILETVREYDEKGNLTRETVTETTEEGEAERLYAHPPISMWPELSSETAKKNQHA